jgi:hypothetical protein
MLSVALVVALSQQVSFLENRRSMAKLETHWISGHKWELEQIPDLSLLDDNHAIEIRRDGVVKLKLSGYDFGGIPIQVARGWYPVGYPVFVVSGHTGMSHGERTVFYAVKGGKLHKMFDIRGEGGGPVFRDIDGDGKNEWIFDNVEHFRASAPAFLLYRQSGTKVTLWKELPNPEEMQLPRPGRYFETPTNSDW